MGPASWPKAGKLADLVLMGPRSMAFLAGSTSSRPEGWPSVRIAAGAFTRGSAECMLAPLVSRRPGAGGAGSGKRGPGEAVQGEGQGRSPRVPVRGGACVRAGREGSECVLGPRCRVCVHQVDRKGLRSVFRFVKLLGKPIKEEG